MIKEKKIYKGIFLYENAFNFCEEIIDLSTMDETNWKKYNKDDLDNKYMPYDSYPVFFSFRSSPSWYLSLKSIYDYAEKYSESFYCLLTRISTVDIIKYRSDNLFPKPGYDELLDSSRNFSAIVFLNEIKSGGEIIFNQLDNISISPKRGSILFYPSNYIYSYKIKKPSSDMYYMNLGFSS